MHVGTDTIQYLLRRRVMNDPGGRSHNQAMKKPLLSNEPDDPGPQPLCDAARDVNGRQPLLS